MNKFNLGKCLISAAIALALTPMAVIADDATATTTLNPPPPPKSMAPATKPAHEHKAKAKAKAKEAQHKAQNPAQSQQSEPLQDIPDPMDLNDD
ncbi:MAG TPA: hypothetical protein VLG38_03520 [Gammaproteobacteria bacterium]|nr:hypothetical protein [Gammaproteobacteria bacterium]